MSLSNTRGAFSSARGYVCLYCRLESGRQRLRFQHTEASHGTASEVELIPQLPKADTLSGTHVERLRSTSQPKVPKSKSETSGALQSKTAGQVCVKLDLSYRIRLPSLS